MKKEIKIEIGGEKDTREGPTKFKDIDMFR